MTSEWCSGANDWGWDNDNEVEDDTARGSGQEFKTVGQLKGERTESETEVRIGGSEIEGMIVPSTCTCTMEGWEEMQSLTKDIESVKKEFETVGPLEGERRESETKVRIGEREIGGTTVPIPSGGTCTYTMEDCEEMQSLTKDIESITLLSTQSTDKAISTPYQCGTHFDSFYINVISEPSSENRDQETRHVEKLLNEYKQENKQEWETVVQKFHPSNGKNLSRNGGKNGIATGGGEKYEKVVAKHGDKTFQKFKKVLSRCPGQIMRYR